MAHMSRMNCLVAMLLVTFVFSGCQSSKNRWMTAWKERTKSKPHFQGIEGSEEITYWPSRRSKTNSKMTEIPNRFKDKMVRKTDPSRRDAELAEFLKEGDQLRKNGQLEDARLVYTKAILIAPENADVHHRLAFIADKQRQYQAADEHYQAALRIRPRDVNLLNDLGYSFALRGDTQQAELTLKEALVIDKSHKGAMANLGAIYAQQNRFPEALEMFRNGATESETQQYIAKLFPQGRTGNGAGPEQGYSQPVPVVASAKESPRDLAKMSFEEIQSEMARLREEARMARERAKQQMLIQARNSAMDDPAPLDPSPPVSTAIHRSPNAPVMLGPQGGNPAGFSNNPPGIEMAQQQPGSMAMPNANGQNQVTLFPSLNDQYAASESPQAAGASRSMGSDPSQMPSSKIPPQTKIFRGTSSQSQRSRPSDPQIQQAWDQQPSSNPFTPIQQMNSTNSASQMATQLGMNAGPGSMFPIVQGSGSERAVSPSSSNSPDNRFGSEFQQTPNSQISPKGNVNTNEQRLTPGANLIGKEEDFIGKEEAPPLAPVSPTSDWGSPTTGTLNWQNENLNGADWSNQTQSTGAAGTGSMPQVTPGNWGQAANRRSDSAEAPQSGVNGIRPRNENEVSRPYNGTWPSTNSLPPRQNPNPAMINRSPETQAIMGVTPMNGTGDSSSWNSSGSLINPSNQSLPQYPFAPNR